MDDFAEQIVPQKMEPRRVLIIVAAVVGVVLVNILALFFLPYILILTVAGGIVAIWQVIVSQMWEVEYSVTNGNIDIDRIVGKSRRKRLVQVRGEKIESLLPVTAERLSAAYDRVVMAANSPQSATWCFTYHSRKNGRTLVLFEPDDRVFAVLRGGLPRLVQMETDRVVREKEEKNQA